MRYMCDSTNIADDPTSFQLVAYYCDGNFAVSAAAVRARFPNAILVPISAIGTNNGLVGDCEPGCMTDDELVTWVVERRAAGVDPTGYVNETYGWAPARAAFARRGVAEPHWWVADYDAVDVIPSGAVAKQDMNSAMTGGHFDKSVVVDFWPGVDNAAGNATEGGFSVTDSEKLDLLVEELGVPLTPGGVADDLLNRTASTLAIVQALQKAAPPSASDVASIVQAANDAKAAALAAQTAAQNAAQTVQAAANTIATAAADIKAIRAKTDKDLN